MGGSRERANGGREAEFPIGGKARWSQLAGKARHALESGGRRGVTKLETLRVMRWNADGAS